MATCSVCGRTSAEDASFCAGCGSPLAPAAPPREERKVVTVVFADLVGSTALAERSDPEDVRALLAAHHARVRGELERYGGTVEKFIGDAVVAVFGAPIAHEDDPERAVRAALAIRDAALEASVELRVAVNTGEALVTLDARPAEGEGMVAGDVINTAARIQSAAPVNGVLVGESTYRATAHVIEYREAEPFEAKGKRDLVQVWEAVVPRARFGSDVEQAPLARLVGREREVDVVRNALTRARHEREPELVTLVGVPGIGKSRIVAELFTIADADPEIIIWRQGRCLPYGEGISYWALGEMAKSQAGILESDTADDASLKLGETIAALLADPSEAAWIGEHLKPLVGLAPEPDAGAGNRGEAFAAWRRFFESLGERRPTVLVFEDLHWADDGLLDFVDSLVARATGVPLLVLCSARPELLARRPGWGGGKPNSVTLSLSPLSDEETARLIAEHLAQAVLPSELQQTLLRRADGNPLFAEEYIRMLRDRGVLRREGGSWRLDAAGVDVPETVQGIIAARLDALSAEEKAALQTASVVGKVFWLGAVASIAGISEWEAEELLHALERKEFVRRDRRASVAGESEYAVRHVLVRDVAYGQIPRTRRAELHVGAAGWIESLGQERSEDRAEMLAYHYGAALELTRAAGGDTTALESAARYALRDAGRRAFALSDLGSAAGLFARALELWPADDPDYPSVQFELGEVLAWHRNEGASELQAAADGLLVVGDVENAAVAEALLGNVHWITGNQEAARLHHTRATGLVAGLPDTRATVRIRAWVWRVLVLANEPTTLVEGEQILALCEALGTTEDVLHSRINLALGYAHFGDPGAAIRGLEVALAESLEANSHLAARAYLNLASVVGTTGDLGRSAELHREGLEAARRFASLHERWLLAECAVDEFMTGSWEAAMITAGSFIADMGSATYMEVGARQVMATVAAARGDRAEADRQAEVMLSRARDIGDPQALWGALGLGARLAVEAGDLLLAETLVRDVASELDAARQFQLDLVQLDGFLAAAALGLGDELGRHLGKAAYPSPWVEAAALISEKRLVEAGDVLHRHDAYSFSALTRLLAAELAGSELPCLHDAIEFYESVGAVASLARAEALLRVAG